MTLSEWIKAGGSINAIANAAGVHYATAWKWTNGKLRPDWKHIPAIEAATGGAVTAQDFVPGAAQ